MTVYSARYTIGSLVLLGHFASIALYLTLVESGGVVLDPDIFVFVDGVAALAPFTLLYATVFYRYVAANPRTVARDRRRQMDVLPFAVQFLTVAAFIAALLFAVWWGCTNVNRIGGVGNISAVVGIVETVFAVFISITFAQLFPMEWEAALDETSVNGLPNEDQTRPPVV